MTDRQKLLSEMTPQEKKDLFDEVRKKIPEDYSPARKELVNKLMDRGVIDFHITDNEGNWKFVYNMTEDQVKEILKSFKRQDDGWFYEIMNGRPEWFNKAGMYVRVAKIWSRRQCLERWVAISATTVQWFSGIRDRIRKIGLHRLGTDKTLVNR